MKTPSELEREKLDKEFEERMRNRSPRNVSKEISRLKDLGDTNWSRPQETKLQKQYREELIQKYSDDKRWAGIQKYGDQILRSNPSYTKDLERDAVKKALGIEKDYKNAVLEMSKKYQGGKEMSQEDIKRLTQLEAEYRGRREAVLTKNFQYQYPNVTVSRTTTGDETIASQYRGAADALLFKTKSMMVSNQLGQLYSIQTFGDGTTIQVKSIFGQDYVHIDTTNSASAISGSGECKCSITLTNVPVVVAPMMHPSHIHTYGDEYPEGAGGGWSGRWGETEVDGIGYHKTYYQVEVEGDCSSYPVQWNICGSTDVDFGFRAGYECRGDFFYLAPPEPYYGGDTYTPEQHSDGYPVIPSNPENHCVWSFSGCHAEILSSGKDDGGTYIIWKAYTEWSWANPYAMIYSRTGLAYMKLKAFIEDNDDKELCSVEHIVKVDCCEKPENERTITLFWEALSGTNHCIWQPFFYYGTIQLCETPEKYSVAWLLRDYINAYVGWWVLPELYGGCLPITWTLEGPGELLTSESGAEWFPPKDKASGVALVDLVGCHEKIIVTATDRCGTSDTMEALSCCECNPVVTILYTSLVMGLSQSQELMAPGGCYPCTWTTTNGTITQSTPGNNIATYTSPSSHAGCADHPIITVTDCCGKSASITICVTDGTVGGAALKYDDVWICGDRVCFDPPYWQVMWQWAYYCDSYDCEGNFISRNGIYNYPACVGWTSGTGIHPTCAEAQAHLDDMLATWSFCMGGTLVGKGLHDVRTAAMIAQGCCPLNPLTGLPY